MELTPYCTKCAGRHWASECPYYGPLVGKGVRQPSLTKVKKPWIKPEIKKYHVFRAVSLTETKSEALDRLESDGVSLTGFDRKTYQKEYMRKKREIERSKDA